MPECYGIKTTFVGSFAWSYVDPNLSAEVAAIRNKVDESPGYTLMALAELGLLDLKATNPECPGGCYTHSRGFHKALLYQIGGQVSGAWVMGNMEVRSETGDIVRYRSYRKRELRPDLGMDICEGLADCFEKIIKHSPETKLVPLIVPLTATKKRGEVGLHQELVIMTVRIRGQREGDIEAELYDPWSPAASRKLTREEAARKLLGNVTHSMITVMGRRGFVLKLLERFVPPFPGPYCKGVQGHEDALHQGPEMEEEDVLVCGRRRAYIKAVEQMATTRGTKYNGYCSAFGTMMLVLCLFFAGMSTITLDGDIVTMFWRAHSNVEGVSGEERFARMTPDMSAFAPVLRRGLGELARCFGLTLYKIGATELDIPMDCCPAAEGGTD